MGLRPGLQISPELQLVRPLGKGAMGTVWVAQHARLQAEVVVKLLSDSHLTDGNIRARFAREVAAAAQVRSPHVVQTLDHGVTEDGTPFIVLELLEGEDLRTVLKKRGHLELQEAALVIESLAAALTKAHDRGIVHRDVKPANVFLCSGGKSWHVKLLDFGVAKLTNNTELTRTGEILGTPSYMSPEQFEGSRTVDHRTDVWALGVLGYHMLVGKVPFRGDSMGSVALAIVTNKPIPPTIARPDLPSGVDAWFARACTRKPEDRFASVRELGDAFAAALLTTTKKYDSVTAIMPRASSPAIDVPDVPVTVPPVPPSAPHQSSHVTAQRGGVLIALGLIATVVVGLMVLRSAGHAKAHDAVSAPPTEPDPVPSASASTTASTTETTAPVAASEVPPQATSPETPPARARAEAGAPKRATTPPKSTPSAAPAFDPKASQ